MTTGLPTAILLATAHQSYLTIGRFFGRNGIHYFLSKTKGPCNPNNLESLKTKKELLSK